MASILFSAQRSLHALALAGASACVLLAPVVTQAATPAPLKTQVPGFYRMALGDFEVTALYDGYIELDTKLFKNATPQEMQKLLARSFVNKSGMQTAVSGYLINTGTNLVLIDTGSAKCFGPTLGALADNLKASGYDASQVDTVVITHLHPDHTCGLIAPDGKLAFPNATLRTAKAESDFWMSEAMPRKHQKMHKTSSSKRANQCNRTSLPENLSHSTITTPSHRASLPCQRLAIRQVTPAIR